MIKNGPVNNDALSSIPRIVIVGAGFGGLAAARALSRENVAVTIIDRRNYHLFQPLLYQVATAALNPPDIASPIRHLMRKQKNARVILGEAISFDLAGRSVILLDDHVPFDYLIVAPGSNPSYFGHDQWAEVAPGLKSIDDATEIRRRFLFAFEAAEREEDPSLQQEWLTFVVVGAGPTGVELAGAFAEIARCVLTREFRRINTARAKIILVEAESRILAGMSPYASAQARRQLERIGVEILTSMPVDSINTSGLTCGNKRIAARTVVWAAGVAASPLGRALGVSVDRAGRIPVTPELALPGHQEVFIVGDLAAASTDGKPVPGLAAAAQQEGKHAAHNVLLAISGKPPKAFRYTDLGTLATVGRGAAVADFRRFRLAGLSAWLLWLLVHIVYLVGFRNRILVLAQWGWVYLRNERGARLITGNIESLQLKSLRSLPKVPQTSVSQAVADNASRIARLRYDERSEA
jgi:NADH dehydrogenase